MLSDLMLVGPIANSYHELYCVTEDITDSIVEVVSAFSVMRKEENFTEEVLAAIEKVLLNELEFSSSVRIPPRHFSGWYPPRFPQSLQKYHW
jgi:hypothetical protein